MADDTGGCFKGDKIDLTSLRTQEQQDMMTALGDALGGMIGQGATPYGGQINAPYDPAMLSAMNMMMQVGGQGPYQPFNFPTMGPQGGAPGGAPGWNTGQSIDMDVYADSTVTADPRGEEPLGKYLMGARPGLKPYRDPRRVELNPLFRPGAGLMGQYEGPYPKRPYIPSEPRGWGK